MKPATNSDSASGKSKGTLNNSAKTQNNNVKSKKITKKRKIKIILKFKTNKIYASNLHKIQIKQANKNLNPKTK